MREMKDSGISWVGEIPKEWSVNRAKYCFVNTKEIAGCRSDRYERLALTMNGVIKRSKDDSNGLQPEKFETYQILRPDELVFKLIDLQNVSTSRVGLSPYLGLVSPAYIILKSNKRVLPAFAEKYFLMLWKNQIFNALGDAGVRSNLNSKDLLELSIPFPSLVEQQRIADFLDRECGKIDGLKENIQSQIDTLEQYKRSVITEAVTHGLNPSAPMKDSKVWYGQIPSEWKELKGKYIFKQRNDRGNNICLRLLSPTQKYGVIPQDKYEELTGMNAVKLNDSTNYALLKTIHKGDYCISLRSFQGGFEYSEYEGVVSPAYQVFYPIATIADGYYKYLFKEKGFIDVMNSYTMSLRDGKNIAFDDFGDTFIPVPPLDEQQEIAEYLDNKCAEIEQIIADKKTQIETLDGYKKSLIFEYVTGKKEVV